MIVREVAVLLPAVGGFQFGRRPNVVLAVGELFVRARAVHTHTAFAAHSRVLLLVPEISKMFTSMEKTSLD